MKDSLANKFPNLLQEWDYKKNKNISPYNISYGSGKKVWWICKNKHPFEMTINHRTSSDSRNCPYCSGRKVLINYNDFKNNYPNIAKEWDYEKNEKKPENYTCKSNYKAFWICSKGHKWKTSICHRTEGSNCPECSKSQKISYRETAVYYYVKKYFPDAINSYKNNWLGKLELDIFIPSLNIGIEYDGELYHKEKNKDLYKNKLCKDNGIILYRIREPNCPSLNDFSIDIFLKNKQLTNLNEAIIFLLKKIYNKSIDVNIDRDNQFIIGLCNFNKKIENNISTNDKLLKEWNYKLNKNFLPKNISLNSNKKVWWICSKKHEWEATPNNRSNGCGCPYCSNNKLLKGFNDLETLYPKIINIWDYNKNKNYVPNNWNIEKQGSFTPSNIIGQGSRYKAFFIGFDEPKTITSILKLTKEQQDEVISRTFHDNI